MFLQFNGFWRENDVTVLTAKIKFELIPKRKLILKEHVAIESNVEKFFKKLDWFKRYKTLKYTLFLKIVTKWREFQKSKLNNFFTNRPFKNVFYI